MTDHLADVTPKLTEAQCRILRLMAEGFLLKSGCGAPPLLVRDGFPDVSLTNQDREALRKAQCLCLEGFSETGASRYERLTPLGEAHAARLAKTD